MRMNRRSRRLLPVLVLTMPVSLGWIVRPSQSTRIMSNNGITNNIAGVAAKHRQQQHNSGRRRGQQWQQQEQQPILPSTQNRERKIFPDFLMTSSSDTAESEKDDKSTKGVDASSETTANGSIIPTKRSVMFPKCSIETISVAAVLMSAFLNLLGFTMAGPITPALGKHFDLTIGASFGSLTSAYPLGMLLGLFIWPQLSDTIGRKPVMTVSLLGSGLGLLGQAAVISRGMSLQWFLASRAFTGIFAGSSPVSKAYLADIGDSNNQLPKYLAWRDAASTGAFIIGPVLGGVLYEIRRRMLGVSQDVAVPELLSMAGSLSYVIGASAMASLAAAVLIMGFVQDQKSMSLRKKKNEGVEIEDKTVTNLPPTNDAGNLVACPLGTRMWTGVASVCFVSFLFNVGDSAYHAFYPALLKDKAGLSPKDIGVLYTLLACISFSVSATGTSGILKRFGPVATCATGMSCIALGLLTMGAAATSSGGTLLSSVMSPTVTVLSAAAAIYYCGVPLYGPTIPTMLLRCVPPNRRGFIMGLDGTVNTIGRIISPLIMGEIYRRYGAGAAFSLAGAAVFGGAMTTIYRRFVVLRGLQQG